MVWLFPRVKFKRKNYSGEGWTAGHAWLDKVLLQLYLYIWIEGWYHVAFVMKWKRRVSYVKAKRGKERLGWKYSLELIISYTVLAAQQFLCQTIIIPTDKCILRIHDVAWLLVKMERRKVGWIGTYLNFRSKPSGLTSRKTRRF